MLLALRQTVWDLIKKRVEALLFTPFLSRCKAPPTPPRTLRPHYF